jgi:hypothetical protein
MFKKDYYIKDMKMIKEKCKLNINLKSKIFKKD